MIAPTGYHLHYYPIDPSACPRPRASLLVQRSSEVTCERHKAHDRPQGGSEGRRKRELEKASLRSRGAVRSPVAVSWRKLRT